MAKDPITGKKIHNSGFHADDVGLKARQLKGVREKGVDMDASWRNRDPLMNPHAQSSESFGDVQAREMDVNQVALDARRKIERILEEEAREQRQNPQAYAQKQRQSRIRQQQAQQPRSSAGLTMSDLMDGLEGQIDAATEEVARDLLVENLSDPTPSEAALYTGSYAGEPKQRPASHDWVTRKFTAKLRSGKSVPVWRVFNSKTKMSMETPFRIAEAAERIATILNQSGDVNDMRIERITDAYKRHRALMKHIRQLREAIKAGNTKMKPKLMEAQDELEQVNIKLGI